MSGDLTWERKKQAEQICEQFEQAWLHGPVPNLRDWLQQHADLQDLLAPNLVELDVHYRQLRGETLSESDYAGLPPEWLAHALQGAEGFRADLNPPVSADPPENSPVPHEDESPALPVRIDRYCVKQRLGRGGFGVVYLAEDPDLDRLVAIKVPTPRARRMLREDWMKEARIVTRLKHPRIVPVHHVGSTPEFPAFIVSEYMAGGSLADRLKDSPLPLSQALDLVIDVAETLDYVHRFEYREHRTLVHRDIKPANLLLDEQGKVYVADFGLAVVETELEQADPTAGTPQYSSPEQVSGEGHKIDGRTDIFALGVVLYELLTGRRPFKANDWPRLKQQITSHDPKPPRQLNPEVSLELERICLKALAKLSSERYSAARDFAADLRRVRDRETLSGMVPGSLPATATPLSGLTTPPATPSATSSGIAGSTPPTPVPVPRIVPRGLGSFEARDAGFFLELLPGPRNADGLPESLAFWKQRIEGGDRRRPLLVGLLCGPSGCGKSSLVKAGLLPRLDPGVITLYLEATPDTTESELLSLLHERIPRLKSKPDLVSALMAVRLGEAELASHRVLLVIDQFEQWLHEHKGAEDTPLTRALRQCDGQHLQALVLVRDDYALSVYRFLRLLEVKLVQGENNAVVDLFDLDHTRKVLTAFGRAYGKLPAEPAELGPAQQQFVQQAVDSLAEQHRVVPVRLALFAEMFKNRSWTPESLVEVGGAEGVGRVFLEETFRSDRALPQYRVHAKAAQQVLTALLPDVGSDIKGHRRSRAELLAAAGYQHRPEEGAELLRILDTELRLITPIETTPQTGAGNSPTPADTSAPTSHDPPRTPSTDYHLTHDYLVPSLRRWLEDLLGQTKEGRAKLLLRERSRVWNDRPLNRHLPGLAEHLRIRRWVPTAERSKPEQMMLRQAARVHGRWTGFAMLGMVLLALGTGWLWQDRRQREAVAQIDRLESAVAGEWPRTFDELRTRELESLAEGPMRERLAAALDKGEPQRVVKLRAGLLATRGDAAQVEPLAEALLTLPVAEFGVVRELLASRTDPAVTAQLWELATDQQLGPAQQRFQATAALARLSPAEPRWPALAPFIARHLASLPAADLVAWRPLLEPVRQALTPEVARLVAQPNLDPIARRAAAETLADYARDDGKVVAEALLESDPATFEVLWRAAAKNSDEAMMHFEQVLAQPSSSDASDEDLEKLHIRQSRAAAGLARLDRVDLVWPKLVFDPRPADLASQDPSLRTEVLHALAEYRVPWQSVVTRLTEKLEAAQREPRDGRETSIQRALLLALGGYTSRLSPEARAQVIGQLKLREVFLTDPDPGIHSACELLLRRWGEKRWLATAQTELRDQQRKPPAPKQGEPRTWFVNSEKQTFVVFPPGVFTMGSPLRERGRIPESEPQHRRKIERSFAIAANEVTRAEYAIFATATNNPVEETPFSKTLEDPYTRVSWIEAAQYCNWLSKEEGLTQCYVINGTGRTATVTMKPKFLELNGYRLPAEAEWEYACRSGVGTAWGHGRAERRLGQYAWFLKTSDEHLWPVGRLLPNEAGLFDMSGNGLEWCQDRALPYETDRVDHPTLLDLDSSVDTNSTRVLRGGSFYGTSTNVRAAIRYSYRPVDGYNYVSFRPSRTYP
ncbi:MAG: protein kinase domain-containing protein [Planctomycetaceae bacterium]